LNDFLPHLLAVTCLSCHFAPVTMLNFHSEHNARRHGPYVLDRSPDCFRSTRYVACIIL
jgi:hypothetical protein